MDDKDGILSNNRIISHELIQLSFEKMKCLLKKNVQEEEFYECFVPFLKNMSAIIECNSLETKKYVSIINKGIIILMDIKNTISFIDDITPLIGDIKAYLKACYDTTEFLRRKQTAKSSIKLYLKKLIGKTGIANKTHAFMNDYNRIVYSSAFRRLQDKAQVFPLEKHDYARTRLTHSIEVSSIAAQLGNITAIRLFSGNNQIKKNVAFQTEKILACAALLHDIGNPPFGHFGEDAIKTFFEDNFDKLKVTIYEKNIEKEIELNSFYRNEFKVMYEHFKTDFTQFDGNAQSFRIATKTQIYKPGHSLELTCSVLGAIIKYPFDSIFAKNILKKAKFGYFYSEKEEFDTLMEMEVVKTNDRNPLVLLLEAADDICYVTSDLDDAIKKGILTYEIFNKELNEIKEADDSLLKFQEKFNEYFDENSKYSGINAFELTMQRMVNDLRIHLIGEVSEEFINQYTTILKGINVANNGQQNNSLKNVHNTKHTYELLECVKSAPLVNWLRSLFAKYVYNNKTIIKNELMGYEIIRYLLDQFVDAVLKLNFKDGKVTKDSAKQHAKQNRVFSLISPNFIQTFKKEVAHIEDKDVLQHVYFRLRLVVDYISGMTDSYAREIYQTLHGF
ncbi:MAG: dNTP triphosphohydrolase [Clostridia bacterium]|nr:dNTP triphosphohydrolase [Clostridia bacterium]